VHCGKSTRGAIAPRDIAARRLAGRRL